MKRHVLGIAVLLFCQGANSKSNSRPEWRDVPVVITYEAFSQLTHAEQLTYVKKLREMMAAIDAQDPSFTARLMQTSPFMNQLLSSALTEASAKEYTDSERIAMTEATLKISKELSDNAAGIAKQKNDLTPQQQANLLARYRNSLVYLGAAGANANAVADPTTKARLKKTLAEASAKADKLQAEILAKTPEVSRSETAKKFDDLKTQYVRPSLDGTLTASSSVPEVARGAKPLADMGNAEIATPPIPQVTVVGTRPSAAAKSVRPGSAVAPPVPNVATNTIPGTAKPSLTVPPSVKPALPPPSLPLPKPPTATLAQPPPAEAQENRPYGGSRSSSGKIGVPKVEAPPTLYRCMHSGFPIVGSECIAPTTSPYELVGIDKAKFVCEDGKVMCNPFIFGVTSEGCDWAKSSENKDLAACWKKAKPLCGYNSRHATANCEKQRLSKDTLDSAVEIIHANHAAFDTFAAQMNAICSNDAIDYDSPKKRSASSREYLKNDITLTCEIAKKSQLAVIKRFNLKYKVDAKTAAVLAGKDGKKAAPASALPAAPAGPSTPAIQ